MKGDFFQFFLDIFQGKTKKVTLISKLGMCQDDKQMHIFRGKHAVWVHVSACTHCKNKQPFSLLETDTLVRTPSDYNFSCLIKCISLQQLLTRFTGMSKTVDREAPEFLELPFGPNYPSESVYMHECVCACTRGMGKGMAVLCFLCRSLLFFRARKMGLCNGHVI